MSRVTDAVLVLRDLLNSQTRGEWFVGMARNTVSALDEDELRELLLQYEDDTEATKTIWSMLE